MSQSLWTAFALVLVIEGLTYALFPGLLKRMMAETQQVSDDRLRLGGVVAVAIGVGLVWLGQTFS
ncbi:MAG TPA: DUF2065 domain-containing protein [Aestuariivirga sp.]|jgi:hypothetical protein|nr:DUF2065 domain-containing protein [Aestuariivirga sp.]